MTFQSTLLTAPMPGVEPDVKIFFHGLLLLRSEDRMTCEVGVHPTATNHVLSIEARTKTPNQPDVIHMRHYGPLGFRQPGMTIEVIEAVPAPAALAFITATEIDYEHGTLAPPEDFRWIINLEGGLFHGDELNSLVFASQHTIKLQGGVYYFYTALRTGDGLRFERTEGGKSPKTLRKIGCVVGARVFLQDNQAIEMRWHDGQEERLLRLSKPQQLNVSHEIYIENSPLYEEPTNSTARARHSELTEYYKIFPNIPEAARFKLEPVREVAPGVLPADAGSLKYGSQRGSPSIPCQPIILNGP